MSATLAKHKTVNRKQSVPQVRFSEFKYPWEEVSFGDLFKFNQTNSFSRDLLNYEKGEVKNIHYGDIHTKFHANFDVTKEEVPFINIDVDISKVKKENYCLEGDLVIADASEDYADVGKAIEVRNLNNEKVVAGLHTLLARPKDNALVSGFAGYLMRSETIRHQIKILAQGTKVLGIAPRHLSQVLFKIPKKDEQTKILSFLESIDLWISNLKTYRRFLVQYKKGMMQKIFSQEIRFNDENGNSYPDCKKQKLSSILVERNEKAPKGDKYPLMAFVAYKGVTPKGERYNREFLVSDSDNKNYKRTEYGDFIYSSNNLETGSIGLNLYGSASISPVYSIFKIAESYDYQFMGSYLVRKSFISKMIKFRQGVMYGQWRIHESDFLKIEEDIPSIEEQKKIADYLKSIDKIIETKEKQIAYADQWKKGLIQQLFI